MLKSMTGYGSASVEFGGKKIRAEIRTLNSKYNDISLRIPASYREKEMDLRSFLSETLIRGKIDLNITISQPDEEEKHMVNIDLIRAYHKELEALQDELQLPESDILSLLLNLPGTLEAPEETFDEKEWKKVDKAVKEAAKDLESFRKDEGAALKDDLIKRAENILRLLKKVSPHEKSRMENIKKRIKQQLKTLREEIDESRFEQELIYYIEKLDISEEKVRLKNHCDYFIKTINDKGSEKGKKLNFIGQEIGREINTLGAKANNLEIQKLVVMMKDDLSRVKEQVQNVL